MENILKVLKTAIGLLNYRLYFPPFSFTFFDVIMFVCVLSIAVYFVKQIFDSWGEKNGIDTTYVKFSAPLRFARSDRLVLCVLGWCYQVA